MVIKIKPDKRYQQFQGKQMLKITIKILYRGKRAKGDRFPSSLQTGPSGPLGWILDPWAEQTGPLSWMLKDFFPRKVCQQGSFNWWDYRPTNPSIQLNWRCDARRHIYYAGTHEGMDWTCPQPFVQLCETRPNQNHVLFELLFYCISL